MTNQPTYAELVSAPRLFSGALHPVTQLLIALRPGDVYDATPNEGSVSAERNRLTSRLRSVRLITGGLYHVTTHNGRLYVVRLVEDGVTK